MKKHLYLIVFAVLTLNVTMQAMETSRCAERWFYAVGKGHAAVVESFLAHGYIDVNVTNPKYGATALHLAVSHGHYHVVKILLNYKADVNKCDKFGDTALGYVIKDCNKRWLWPLGYFIFVKDCEHSENEEFEEAIIEMLLEAGADANRIDKYGSTALHEAIVRENVKHVCTLLKEADPNFIGRDFMGRLELPALHEAVIKDNETIVKALLSAGANVNAVDQYGRTALHVVIEDQWGKYARPEMVAILLGAGADPNVIDGEDHTPLYLAADALNANIIEMLLKAGADINATNRAGRTALDLAAAYGEQHATVIKILLWAGAKR